MKIPTHYTEQHNLPIMKNESVPVASNFQLLLGKGNGEVKMYNFPLTPEDENKLIFFPSWLKISKPFFP
jgi:hypothetical protein